MLIKKNTDTSMFYNLNEEELQKDFKEIKADLVVSVSIVFFDYISFFSKKIISKNNSRHDNISNEIFLPPPEII